MTAHRRVGTPAVVEAFNKAAARFGPPASVLTDNAMYFTTRFAGGRGGANAFETLLSDLGVTHKHSRPGHPRTCGKVERFQQTLKRWREPSPKPEAPPSCRPSSTTSDTYNNHRPHRSIGRAVPAAVYGRLPKDRPRTSGAEPPWRIRRDRIDAGGTVTIRHKGRLHHIGIGRRWDTPILMIVRGIIDSATGQLIRQLQLDPTRDYQELTAAWVHQVPMS